MQFNRLSSGVGRYAANMVKWGIGISSACLCGEIQTGGHVLKCHTIGPPCLHQNVEDPRLINYLNCAIFSHRLSLFSVIVCVSVAVHAAAAVADLYEIKNIIIKKYQHCQGRAKNTKEGFTMGGYALSSFVAIVFNSSTPPPPPHSPRGNQPLNSSQNFLPS